MKRKTLIKILIILIILVILGIILFSSIFRKEEKTSEKQNGYEDETITSIKYENNNKYEPSIINREYTILTEEQRNKIDSRIDELIENLNQRNYETLYNMLEENYRDLRFSDDIEEFKKYINENIPFTCHCINYRVASYGCYVKIGFEGASKDSVIEVLLQNCTYEEIGTEAVELYFEDIIDVQAIVRTFNTPEVVVTQEYFVKYSDKTSIYLEIKNKTGQNQIVDFANTQLIFDKTRYLKKYDPLNETKVSVPANGMATLEIDYDYAGDNLYNASWINFRLKINDKNYAYNSYAYKQEDIEEYQDMD